MLHVLQWNRNLELCPQNSEGNSAPVCRGILWLAFFRESDDSKIRLFVHSRYKDMPTLHISHATFNRSSGWHRNYGIPCRLRQTQSSVQCLSRRSEPRRFFSMVSHPFSRTKPGWIRLSLEFLRRSVNLVASFLPRDTLSAWSRHAQTFAFKTLSITHRSRTFKWRCTTPVMWTNGSPTRYEAIWSVKRDMCNLWTLICTLAAYRAAGSSETSSVVLFAKAGRLS